MVMGLLLDHVKVLLCIFWTSFWLFSGSGRALLAGTLPLRYCSTRFAGMTPSWRLPVFGSVSNLVAAYAGHRVAVDEVDREPTKQNNQQTTNKQPRTVWTRFTGLVVLVLIGNEFD